jgi:hypothetical protein
MDLQNENTIKMVKYFPHEVYGNTIIGHVLLLQVLASQLEAGLPNHIERGPKFTSLISHQLDIIHAVQVVYVQAHHSDNIDRFLQR